MQMTRAASCEVEEEEQTSRIRHMQSLYIKDGYSSYDHTAASTVSTVSTISILVAERPGCDDIVHRAHWLLTCGESWVSGLMSQLIKSD